MTNKNRAYDPPLKLEAAPPSSSPLSPFPLPLPSPSLSLPPSVPSLPSLRSRALQLWGLGERCKLPQRRPGLPPAAEAFLAYLEL